MKRLGVASGFLVLFAVLARPGVADAAATFDPSVSGLRLARDADALMTYDFETGDGLVGASLVAWDKSGGGPRAMKTKVITSGADVADLLTAGGDDAVEGAHAIRLTNGQGFALTDPNLLARLKDGRFEVTVWVRSDGTLPQFQVVYGKDPATALAGYQQFASVRGIRTGRETSDGWAEYTTGPVDGSVWTIPVVAITVAPSFSASATDSFLVDAFEVRKVDGSPTAKMACTQQNVDAVCGAEGECFFGHCVPSSVTWGVLPSLKQRRDIAERWITFATRIIGDRNAMRNGVEIFTPGARALAESAASSRQFFGGMNRLVNLLRDNHTSFGFPASYFTNFSPQVTYETSSTLGACFGVVEKDLLGGGLGFAVFDSVENPLTGTPLKRGDVIIAIDGRDPKAWIDDVWPYNATAFPNDPRSDWGPVANSLSRLMAMRASNVTIARCASSKSCADGERETMTIDLASVLYKGVVEGVPDGISQSLYCTPRFSETVANGCGPDGSGEDPICTGPGTVGETRIQFDGFVGQNKWKTSFTTIFSASPTAVMMDARSGHGGYYDALEHLYNLLRGTSEPAGVMSLGRGTFDMTDPTWLFTRLGGCTEQTASNQWECYQGNGVGFFSTVAAPPGEKTRIAWLNTSDVSANDFMPRLLKGRSRVQIFGPHPTSGAFGAITSLPSLWTGWAGGSLQVQDSRFAGDLEGAEAARWESGHGVEPDVVVAQKLSDAISGVDTIVQTATAWLAPQ
ncbi:hypothetical protein AKJ09_10082 [Labilithrix luteola]|uniref:Tail specific protease domain-containing protein n=1 Tax=Labilithrix luteola TaxID=1391654 RepID=A0A0K1QCE6_9BACT|nr:hypothetical protein [Labilithrix luteola]AKV03419.1 hypothetical protein AKJ09_10082 [Labilithrix luteola]